MCAVLFDSASGVKITSYVGLYVQRKIMLQIVYYLLGAFAKLRKATVRFLVPVRPHGTAPTERMFVKFDI
jgi:hypothetical protein